MSTENTPDGPAVLSTDRLCLRTKKGNMKATDNRCDLCKYWDYHYQDDMGACTLDSGPQNATGFAVPVAKAVMSSHVKSRNKGGTATTCDTRCNAWKSDETQKANKVRDLRHNAPLIGAEHPHRADC